MCGVPLSQTRCRADRVAGGGYLSAEPPRTTQERLFSQPQPSPSGSLELLLQYG